MLLSVFQSLPPTPFFLSHNSSHSGFGRLSVQLGQFDCVGNMKRRRGWEADSPVKNLVAAFLPAERGVVERSPWLGKILTYEAKRKKLIFYVQLRTKGGAKALCRPRHRPYAHRQRSGCDQSHSQRRLRLGRPGHHTCLQESPHDPSE